MKTYVLSENAMSQIENQFQLLESMIESDQEIDVSVFLSELDKIESIMSRKYDVRSSVIDSINKTMRTPFPNFDISKYEIDIDNDIIKRGDGTVLTESNATTAEKTLLDVYKGIVEEADETDAEIREHINAIKAEIFS